MKATAESAETTAPTEEQRALARELFEEFAHLGHAIRPDMRNIARGEMAVVRTLHLAVEAGELPITPSVIAERAHLSTARTANVLRSLEEKGWIRREHATDDRRRVTVVLTDEGEAVRVSRREEFEGHAAAFLARLGEEDTREAIRILKRCNQIVKEYHEEEDAR